MSQFKTQVVQSTPDDAVYLKEFDFLVCPFCKNMHGGRRKVWKNLWSLKHHFSYNHSDGECEKVIAELAYLIRLGVFR